MKKFLGRYSVAAAKFLDAFIFLSALAINAQFSLAATAPVITVTPSNITSSLCTAVNWLFFGLIVLASIMILVGAYLYVTARGNPETVTKANKTLLYAMIGIVIALIARGFPQTVANLFSAGTVATC